MCVMMAHAPKLEWDGFHWISKSLVFINNQEIMNDIEQIFENYNINKLDLQRIYRYIDKSVKKDALTKIDNDDGI